jgi:carbon storage regulator
MLVLTRKLGEEIVIGENIRVRVLAVRGNRVRLGLAAPTGVPIRREEIGALPDDQGPVPGCLSPHEGMP